MANEITDFIASVTKATNRYALNEEATKQGIVLPLLSFLGWNRDDVLEVMPEYAVGTGRVDYCLKRGEESLLFVEVKRVAEPLDGHQEQLLRYAFEQGVGIAILTDGLRWWLYLPTQSGSWQQRKFLTLDLQEQDPTHVASHLRQFLDRDAVFNGSALRAAQELHASRAKEEKVLAAIPRAWRELCEEADAGLIDLLADKVEGLCGHRPDPEVLAEFIANGPHQSGHGGAGAEPAKNVDSRTQPAGSRERNPNPQQWTFQKPLSYTFLREVEQVSTFKDILLGLTAKIHARHTSDFWIRVSELQSSRGRRYFSREPNDLQEPREVGNSGIYVETCLSANGVRSRCRELLEAFGYADDAFSVRLRPRG